MSLESNVDRLKELFPREFGAVSQGLKFIEEIHRPDDRHLRVYAGDNGNISIYSDNGFYAGYKTELGGELLAYSDTEGAKMREGTKDELFLLMDMVKEVLMRLTPEQQETVFGDFVDDGDLQRRIEMFGQFFTLIPEPGSQTRFLIKLKVVDSVSGH